MYSIEEIEKRKREILQLKLDLRFVYHIQEKALGAAGLTLPVEDLELQQLLHDDPEVNEYLDKFKEKFNHMYL